MKQLREIGGDVHNFFLDELGFLGWEYGRVLTFVGSYSDIDRYGDCRLDADYYQPCYSELVDGIKRCSGGWDTLGNLVEIRKGVDVGSGEYVENGIPFIRVSDLSSFDIGEEKRVSEELYEELSDYQPECGDILLSKDGTPGIAYYVRDGRRMLPSGYLLRLSVIDGRVSGEYLFVVLNSLLVQEQVRRDVSGSIISHWRPDQVSNVVVPILDRDKQEKIRECVRESFRLWDCSMSLFGCARRVVEVVVGYGDHGEQTAMRWLEKKLERDSEKKIGWGIVGKCLFVVMMLR